MLRRFLIGSSLLVFSFAVLFTSIFRTATPQYAFSQVLGAQTASGSALFVSSVDYYLPYPGVLPDHFLWPVKVLRDKLWLFVTRDSAKRSDILLLFADKRVGMGRELIRGGKAELGVPTVEKAEQYLQASFEEQEKARASGMDTTDLLTRLAKASLKHIEEIDNMIMFAPEDAKPVLNKIADMPKSVYEKAVHGLNEKGRPIPIPSPLPTPTP